MQFDIADARAGRTLHAQPYECLHGLVRPRYQRLDRAVGAVANSAVDAQPHRFHDHEIAITDRLHEPFDPQAHMGKADVILRHA